MKTKRLLILAIAGALPGVGFGQFTADFTFNVFGVADYDNPDIYSEIGAISALIEIDTEEAAFGRIDVKVTNTGPLESDIVAFYLRKPVYGNDTPPLGVSITGYDPALPVSGLDNEWIAENAMPANANLDDFAYHGLIDGVESPSVTLFDYFGAQLTNPPDNRISFPDYQIFTFQFEPLGALSFANYLTNTDSEPMAFVRWQNVGPYDGSGKGWAGQGPSDAVVPEPSQIAFLAILGLGGVLWVRRRRK